MTNRDRMILKIERIVELEYNQLDRRLINHEIDQDQYDEEARLIEEWASDMYNDMDAG
jgi:hypothetical protein